MIEMSEQGQAVYWYLFTKQLLIIHLWLHEHDPDRQNSINYITQLWAFFSVGNALTC